MLTIYFVYRYEHFDDCEKIRNVVLELANKHYPDEDSPIIRFYAGSYDVDFAS